MSNDYYEIAPGTFVPFTTARAEDVEAQFTGVAEGFELLPSPDALAQNRLGYVVAGGTANAITGALAVVPSAYADGMCIRLKVTTSNTGAVTINLNGLGAVAVQHADGDALVSGELAAGGIVEIVYVGGAFRLMTTSVTSAAAGAAAGAITGATAGTTAGTAAGTAAGTTAGTTAGTAAGLAAAAPHAAAAAASASQALISALTAGAYPNDATLAVPRGVLTCAINAAGSGGTNGTFTGTFTGGGGAHAQFTFTVVGGALATITDLKPGYSYETTPTADFSASAGLTGATATVTSGHLVPSGEFYWALSGDGLYLQRYQNASGSPAIVVGETVKTKAGMDADVEAVAAAAAERRKYYSVRFPRDNAEEAESGLNGHIYLPNSNNFFKTTVNFDTPLFETTNEDAIAIMCEVPLERYAWMQRAPVMIGTGGETNPRTLNMGYVPSQSGVNGPKGYFWCRLRGEGTPDTGRIASALMPSDFSGRGMPVFRRVGDTFVTDVWDLQSRTKIAGTPVAMPVGWLGIGRLTHNITFGGKEESGFPYDYDNTFGRHGLFAWHGSLAHALFVDGVTSDAQWQAIADGADIATELGTGNLRMHAPLALNGLLSLTVTSNKAAVVDAPSVRGVLYPGSTLRRQAAATYLTVNAVPNPCLISREKNAETALMQFSGEYAGLTGFLQARIIDETSVILKDWHTIAKHSSFVGGVWSATVEFPKSNKQVGVEFRFTSNTAVTASVNSEIWVGQAVTFWSQSEGFYAVALTGTQSGTNTSLNTRFEGDAGRSVFQLIGPTANGKAIRTSEICTGLLGDEFVTICNRIRRRTQEPIFVICHSLSGTSLVDLMDDATSSRDWATDLAMARQMGNRGPNGEVVVSAHIFGGWEAFASGVEVVPDNYFPAFLWGVESPRVTQAQIDHYLYNGDFSLSAEFIVMPNNRAMTWATQDSDRSGEADQRDAFRNSAATYGYRVGPETTVHTLEGTTGNVTHPRPNDLEGSQEMAAAVAEAICMGLGVGTYQGPGFFTSAAFVAGSGNLQVDVTFEPAAADAPGGFLYTKAVGGNPALGFEAKLSTAGAWGRSNITGTGVITTPRTMRLTLSSPGVPGETLLAYHPGSPGNYDAIGALSATDAAWRAGALMFAGWPVAGGNTAIAVS